MRGARSTPCLCMSPIQVPSHEVKQAWAGVLEPTAHLREKIQERGEADWMVCGKVKEVGEPVLTGPKQGYEDEDLSVPLHFAENLQEEWDGWEGVAEFSCPG